MGSRLRALVERLLPWYDAAERLRGFAARDQLGSYGRVRIQR